MKTEKGKTDDTDIDMDIQIHLSRNRKHGYNRKDK